jgi:hypothetical protein
MSVPAESLAGGSEAQFELGAGLATPRRCHLADDTGRRDRVRPARRQPNRQQLHPSAPHSACPRRAYSRAAARASSSDVSMSSSTCAMRDSSSRASGSMMPRRSDWQTRTVAWAGLTRLGEEAR